MPSDPSKPCSDQPCTRPRAQGRSRCAHHERERKRGRRQRRGAPRAPRDAPRSAKGDGGDAGRPPLRLHPRSTAIPSDEQIVDFLARIAAGLASDHDYEIAGVAERAARVVLAYREAHRGAGEGTAGRSVIEETLKAHGTAGVDEINAMVDAADQQAAAGDATEAS